MNISKVHLGNAGNFIFCLMDLFEKYIPSISNYCFIITTDAIIADTISDQKPVYCEFTCKVRNKFSKSIVFRDFRNFIL